MKTVIQSEYSRWPSICGWAPPHQAESLNQQADLPEELLPDCSELGHPFSSCLWSCTETPAFPGPQAWQAFKPALHHWVCWVSTACRRSRQILELVSLHTLMSQFTVNPWVDRPIHPLGCVSGESQHNPQGRLQFCSLQRVI